MRYKFNLKRAATVFVYVLAFGLAASANAVEKIKHIDKSERSGPDSGWNIRYDNDAHIYVASFYDYFNSSNQRIIPMGITLPIDNPALTYSFRFEESASQTSAADDFGLRTAYMYFRIENKSSYNITGLHFILSDLSSVARNGAPPVHPGYAHFHLGAPEPLLSTYNPGYLAMNSVGTEVKIYTHIRGATLLGPGQVLQLTGAEGFGIHQFEVQGQNRSFQLFVIPEYAIPK